MALLKKIIILFLTVIIMVAAWYINKFLKEKINPRRSVGHFILFFVANIVAVFSLIVLMSVILLKYKDFFFKP